MVEHKVFWKSTWEWHKARLYGSTVFSCFRNLHSDFYRVYTGKIPTISVKCPSSTSSPVFRVLCSFDDERCSWSEMESQCSLNFQVPDVGHCFTYVQIIFLDACPFYSSAHLVPILFLYLGFAILYIF